MKNNILKLSYLLFKQAEEKLTVVESRSILVDSLNQAAKELTYGVYGVKLSEKTTKGLAFILKKLTDYILSDPNYPGVSKDDPGKITFYHKKLEESLGESEDVNRQQTTLGRYIKRKFIPSIDETFEFIGKENKVSEVFDDATIDLFVKEATASIIDSLNILEKDIGGVSGREIVDRYRNLKGTRMDSCMTGLDCSKMQLLSNNPDKVSLLNMHDKARALLWTTDDGTKVLDRIYPPNSKYVNFFIKWAKKNDYVYREDPSAIVNVNQTVKLSSGKDYMVTMSAKGIGEYPYLDTFRFGKFEGNNLKLSNNVNFGDLKFVADDGAYREGSLCEDCGDYFDENYGGLWVDDSFYCEDCLENEFNVCINCEKYFRSEDEYEDYCSDCAEKEDNGS